MNIAQRNNVVQPLVERAGMSGLKAGAIAGLAVGALVGWMTLLRITASSVDPTSFVGIGEFALLGVGLAISLLVSAPLGVALGGLVGAVIQALNSERLAPAIGALATAAATVGLYVTQKTDPAGIRFVVMDVVLVGLSAVVGWFGGTAYRKMLSPRRAGD
jgi:hypothetical protein